MVLEVAIGLIFVYLLFSLICSAFSELVAWFLNLRARTLKDGVETLLRDPSLAALMQQNPKLKGMYEQGIAVGKQAQNVASTIYSHPLIQGIMHDGKLPAYIPKDIFASAFLDLLRSVAKKDDGSQQGFQKLLAAVASLPEESQIRQQLSAVLDDTVTDFREARDRVEKWFDDSMARVSAWYKRRAQIIVLVIATVVVFIANADSVMIVRSIAHDSALRAGLVAAAERSVQSGAPEPREVPDPGAALEQLRKAQKELNNLRLPIGWSFAPPAETDEMPDPRRMPEGWDWLGKIAGLLFTIFAVSMGAPFWFDILNKVVNARITGGQQPEQKKAPKEKEGPPQE